MTEPHDLREQQTRGLRAAEILESDVLLSALKAIEDEVIQQWEACPARDADGKEALWQLFKTSKKFRAILLGYVESGKLATEQLNRWEKEGRLRSLARRLG